MQDYETLKAAGQISIWLGNLDDELELDDYLDDSFPADFGFEIPQAAGPEACVEASAQPVATLLDGFSQSALFAAAASELAASQGWNDATTALVFYHMAYRPELAIPNTKFALTYIGTLPLAQP